ncbi:MAG: hypothetical protein ABI845_05615, partial [Polaromonas sp.]
MSLPIVRCLLIIPSELEPAKYLSGLTSSSAVRGTAARPPERQAGGRRFQALSKPNLDHGLPRHPKFTGFPIQSINHLGREIDIHALLRLQDTPDF